MWNEGSPTPCALSCFAMGLICYARKSYINILLIWLSIVGGKFPASALTKQEVEAYRKNESQDMHKTLDAYLLISQRMGVFSMCLYHSFISELT